MNVKDVEQRFDALDDRTQFTRLLAQKNQFIDRLLSEEKKKNRVISGLRARYNRLLKHAKQSGQLDDKNSEPERLTSDQEQNKRQKTDHPAGACDDEKVPQEQVNRLERELLCSEHKVLCLESQYAAARAENRKLRKMLSGQAPQKHERTAGKREPGTFPLDLKVLSQRLAALESFQAARKTIVDSSKASEEGAVLNENGDLAGVKRARKPDGDNPTVSEEGAVLNENDDLAGVKRARKPDGHSPKACEEGAVLTENEDLVAAKRATAMLVNELTKVYQSFLSLNSKVESTYDENAALEDAVMTLESDLAMAIERVSELTYRLTTSTEKVASLTIELYKTLEEERSSQSQLKVCTNSHVAAASQRQSQAPPRSPTTAAAIVWQKR